MILNFYLRLLEWSWVLSGYYIFFIDRIKRILDIVLLDELSGRYLVVELKVLCLVFFLIGRYF